MATKLTTMTHKIAIQQHLVAESCTICSSRSIRPVRKLLDIPSYFVLRIDNVATNKKKKNALVITQEVYSKEIQEGLQKCNWNIRCLVSESLSGNRGRITSHYTATSGSYDLSVSVYNGKTICNIAYVCTWL
jgi:hypothetical protein